MKLSFEDVKNNASSQTLEKAQSYVNKFTQWTTQGETLRGTVPGSAGNVYHVEVCCSDQDYLKASCSCPVKTEFCKHAAALCLTYLAGKSTPKSLLVTPEQAILAMSEMTLKEKIISLLPEFPGLADRLTDGLLLQSSAAKSSPEEDEDGEEWEQIEF